MGLNVELFIDSVDECLKCTLCNAVFEEPVVTSCGHVYCVACLRDWVGKRGSCPRSCKQIYFVDEDVTRLLPLQKLVNQLRVRCVHHVKGCEAVHTVDGMLAHMEVCEYEREAPRENTTTTTTTTMAGSNIKSYMNSDQPPTGGGGCCERPPEVGEFSQALVCKKGCGLPLLFQDSTDHDCVRSLQAQVGSLQAKLTRTEHDKEKVSQRLVKREECMQERFTQLEKELRQYQEQTLKYEWVAMDQCSQIKYLQRQLDHHCDEASEDSEVKVVLERHDGALGFNIRGGTKEDCGLYVSKIVENSPASQPGKLQLYDRILQIDNVNLTNASHEEAVRAFKNAGDTLDITVRRLFNPRVGTDMLTSSAAVVSIGVQTDVIETSEMSRTPLTCCRCSNSSNRSSQEFSSQGGINFLHQREDSGVDETGEHPSDVELHNGCDSNEPLDKRKAAEEYGSAFASGNGVILNKLLLNTSLAALDKRGSRGLARGEDHSQAAYGEEDNSELYSLSNGYYSGNVSQASLENVKQGVAENENVPSFDDRNDATRTDEMDGNEGSAVDDLQDYNGFNDNDQLYFDSELEYEYEEITIRMRGQKSLGMSIYSGDGEDINSVFVKGVDPQLLVGKDGRVIEGDQILKINDLAITCFTEAADLLGRRRNDEIRFLVARPVAELQATLLGAESDHGESPSDLQTPRFHLEAFPIGVIPEEDEDEVETIMGDKCEKDSGFGRTDESLKNDESSEQDGGDDHRHKGSPKEQHKAQMDALGKQIMHFTACASNTREQLLRDSPRERSSDEHSQRSSERERREGKNSKHGSRRSSTKTSTDENTHSSGHERRTTRKSQRSPKNSDTSPAAASRHKERSESKEKDKSEHRRSKKDRAKDTADSGRLTNGSRAPRDEHAPAHKQNGDQQSCSENGGMKVEWRVRRNKDGSRIFVSKKLCPAKQKLLRERAQKLAEERRGLTTDDETQSVYLGRYWNRDDRRRQLDKVREARRVKKVEFDTELLNGGAQKRNDLAIIQLTQKKMACMDQTFDDFITVDEILRQRNRMGLSNGPIFVTTV